MENSEKEKILAFLKQKPPKYSADLSEIARHLLELEGKKIQHYRRRWLTKSKKLEYSSEEHPEDYKAMIENVEKLCEELSEEGKVEIRPASSESQDTEIILVNKSE